MGDWSGPSPVDWDLANDPAGIEFVPQTGDDCGAALKKAADGDEVKGGRIYDALHDATAERLETAEAESTCRPEATGDGVDGEQQFGEDLVHRGVVAGLKRGTPAAEQGNLLTVQDPQGCGPKREGSAQAGSPSREFRTANTS